MTIANGLAERIDSLRYDTLPEDALHWARVAILEPSASPSPAPANPAPASPRAC